MGKSGTSGLMVGRGCRKCVGVGMGCIGYGPESGNLSVNLGHFLLRLGRGEMGLVGVWIHSWDTIYQFWLVEGPQFGCVVGTIQGVKGANFVCLFYHHVCPVCATFQVHIAGVEMLCYW